jgi:hypothetical protein
MPFFFPLTLWMEFSFFAAAPYCLASDFGDFDDAADRPLLPAGTLSAAGSAAADDAFQIRIHLAQWPGGLRALAPARSPDGAFRWALEIWVYFED